jgi:hypothetical protein
MGKETVETNARVESMRDRERSGKAARGLREGKWRCQGDREGLCKLQESGQLIDAMKRIPGVEMHVRAMEKIMKAAEASSPVQGFVCFADR